MYPKIGIRPTIDGRWGGVRESLEDKVYRPHSWSSFGTEDAQAADYAACKKYGPMYK